jgi:hypothetical protein
MPVWGLVSKNSVTCYADMDYNAIVKNLATGYVLYGNCSPTVSNVSIIK